MDDIATSTLFIILGVLIFISAYFSGTETGMVSVNRYKLRHLAQSGDRGAKRVSKLLDRPDRLIGLILIGNNLVNILASAIATIIGLRLYGDAGIAVATVVLTLVILIFAEVTPKTIAALNPERIAMPSSIIISLLMKVMLPFVIAINFITNNMMRLFGVNPTEQQKDALSADELRTIVNEAGSLIPSRHQDMLVSVLDLEKVTVDDIMVPRNEIVAVDINEDWSLIMKQLMTMQHTRILLYRNQIDDAIGFLHARDMMRLVTRYQAEPDKASLVRAARDIYFIPEGTPLNVQLVKFQRNKERVGLVVDEYGDIQGLVTLEDILEEIVGDFTTTITGTTSDHVALQADGSYIIDGTTNLRELNKDLNWSFPTDGPKTINGLIIETFGDIPEAPMCLVVGKYRIEVTDVDNNMVKAVRVHAAKRKRKKTA
ncbi:HlyC/CorC family transporter [Aliidiomarina maris]|uniref:Magnesium/cobalt efflux protein n=1 Tax=Aliidiomarina maris TaxID=531312 RepID=A0A327X4D3_9GAMM|nr:CNNM domain-containing protein [Aliidiomarina maris]MBA3989114.1 magnesium/cobalt efflux protein [Idiomarina sp.]MCL5050893.1 CNNM domain-containing protein [Bacillota bacterium]RAK01745.1 Mg2+/Co2+ transporter CorB [Aliidiomarina maris]RUO28562.1 magnesium/cobalt efflux protein [Aliidiomarina maris]